MVGSKIYLNNTFVGYRKIWKKKYLKEVLKTQ
jgi:hypothetical protein